MIDAEKIEAITAALDGGASKAAVCRNFGVARSTLIDTLARRLHCGALTLTKPPRVCGKDGETSLTGILPHAVMISAKLPFPQENAKSNTNEIAVMFHNIYYANLIDPDFGDQAP